MTHEQLNSIRDQHNRYSRIKRTGDCSDRLVAKTQLAIMADADIPILLNEVERLQAEIAAKEVVNQMYSATVDMIRAELVQAKRELAEYEETGLMPAEVADLAKAKAERRLHIATCCNGKSIYYVHDDDFCEDAWIEETSYLYGVTEYELGELGHEWFLTEEEAEQALKKENEPC